MSAMIRQVDLVFNDLKSDMNNLNNEEYSRQCGSCGKAILATDKVINALGKVRS
mgnify:CR=1 FL=1